MGISTSTEKFQTKSASKMPLIKTKFPIKLPSNETKTVPNNFFNMEGLPPVDEDTKKMPYASFSTIKPTGNSSNMTVEFKVEPNKPPNNDVDFWNVEDEDVVDSKKKEKEKKEKDLQPNPKNEEIDYEALMNDSLDDIFPELESIALSKTKKSEIVQPKKEKEIDDFVDFDNDGFEEEFMKGNFITSSGKLQTNSVSAQLSSANKCTDESSEQMQNLSEHFSQAMSSLTVPTQGIKRILSTDSNSTSSPRLPTKSINNGSDNNKMLFSNVHYSFSESKHIFNFVVKTENQCSEAGPSSSALPAESHRVESIVLQQHKNLTANSEFCSLPGISVRGFRTTSGVIVTICGEPRKDISESQQNDMLNIAKGIAIYTWQYQKTIKTTDL